MRIRLQTSAILLVLAAAAGSLWAQSNGPRAALQLDPAGQAGLDERVMLRIKLEGVKSGRPQPDFQLDNLRILAGPSQSTSLTIINGVPSSSLTLTYSLQPLNVGKARVHSARVRLGDQLLELPDREIQILEETPPGRRRQVARDPLDSFRNDPFFDRRSPLEELLLGRRRQQRRRQQQAPRVFLQAETSPRKPWVGEQVLYTLYLYTDVDVRSINPEELPDFKGFWSRTIPQPERIQPELVTHEGQDIYRFVLLQRALFPRRGGAFEIPRVEATMDALVRTNDPFGSLLPRARQISRTSNPVTVEVRELPAPPAGFQGVVGQISLVADLAPRELEVGEAATLTLTLSGRGHLQGIAPPEVGELDGIEVFPPQQQSDETLRGKSVTGSRTWSYVLVPQRPGEWQLPPIEVPYFDPRRDRYASAVAADLGLMVRGTTSLEPSGGQTVELHPIRSGALPIVAGSRFDGSTLRPWLFGLPWGLAALLLGFRRFAGGSRSSEGRKRLLERLKAAAGEERPRQAAALLEDAWREFLEFRWDIPPGVPSTQWGGLLEAHGVQGANADGLVKLADDLHYLRYAPKLSSTAELRKELVERSRKLVRSLG
ncbi:MAG: BatD family protein [Thermoanaerobaculia bacterium]